MYTVFSTTCTLAQAGVVGPALQLLNAPANMTNKSMEAILVLKAFKEESPPSLKVWLESQIY